MSPPRVTIWRDLMPRVDDRKAGTGVFLSVETDNRQQPRKARLTLRSTEESVELKLKHVPAGEPGETQLYTSDREGPSWPVDSEVEVELLMEEDDVELWVRLPPVKITDTN